MTKLRFFVLAVVTIVIACGKNNPLPVEPNGRPRAGKFALNTDVTINSVPTQTGEVVRALITVGTSTGTWYRKSTGYGTLSADSDVAVNDTLTINRVRWRRNEIDLQGEGTGAFNNVFGSGGLGENAKVYIVTPYGSMAVQVLDSVDDMGVHWMQWDTSTAQRTVLSQVVTGDLVNLVIADFETDDDVSGTVTINSVPAQTGEVVRALITVGTSTGTWYRKSTGYGTLSEDSDVAVNDTLTINRIRWRKNEIDLQREGTGAFSDAFGSGNDGENAKVYIVTPYGDMAVQVLDSVDALGGHWMQWDTNTAQRAILSQVSEGDRINLVIADFAEVLPPPIIIPPDPEPPVLESNHGDATVKIFGDTITYVMADRSEEKWIRVAIEVVNAGSDTDSSDVDTSVDWDYEQIQIKVTQTADLIKKIHSGNITGNPNDGVHDPAAVDVDKIVPANVSNKAEYSVTVKERLGTKIDVKTDGVGGDVGGDDNLAMGLEVYKVNRATRAIGGRLQNGDPVDDGGYILGRFGEPRELYGVAREYRSVAVGSVGIELKGSGTGKITISAQVPTKKTRSVHELKSNTDTAYNDLIYIVTTSTSACGTADVCGGSIEINIR